MSEYMIEDDSAEAAADLGTRMLQDARSFYLVMVREDGKVFATYPVATEHWDEDRPKLNECVRDMATFVADSPL